MHFFASLGIRTKLLSLVVLSFAGLAAIVPVALNAIRAQMMEDRSVKTRHLTEIAHGVLAHFHEIESAGQMTREQAQAAAVQAIAKLRYEKVEYFWINDMQPRMIVHPRTELNGKDLSDFKDPNGNALFIRFVEIVKRDGAGFHYYLWPKPGSDAPVEKVSYVQGFRPWGWVIGTGIYIDDVDALFWREARLFGAICLAIAAVVLAGCWLVARGISMPIGAISALMQRLAKGEKQIDVPYVERRDEIGAIAGSVQVFKDAMIEADRLRVEQEEAKARAAEERKAALYSMADDFERNVGGIVEAVATASAEMQKSAQMMSATSDTSGRQAGTVAAAATQATANVQTVASAAEELSSSIREISQQVTQSSRVALEAVEQAGRTNETVEGLAAAAQKVGEVVRLIHDIAGQTNLLALNATIEAARAGEHGKGFTVVASEVKSLATQTARATEEITAEIGQIQAATQQAVEAIRDISATIKRISEFTASIASAVEEQGAATQEIAGNVQQAAQGTQEVSTNIVGVAQASKDAGTAASQVLGSATELSQQSARLQEQVAGFLSTIRAA